MLQSKKAAKPNSVSETNLLRARTSRTRWSSSTTPFSRRCGIKPGRSDALGKITLTVLVLCFCLLNHTFIFFVRGNILVLTSLFNILKEVISRPLIIGKSHSSEGTTKCTEVRCEPCSLIFSGESSAKSGRECFNRSAETFSRLLSREWWSAKIARMIGAASVRISPVLAISRSLCIKQAVSPSHLLNLYWDVLLRFPLANLVWNHWQ